MPPILKQEFELEKAIKNNSRLFKFEMKINGGTLPKIGQPIFPPPAAKLIIPKEWRDAFLKEFNATASLRIRTIGFNGNTFVGVPQSHMKGTTKVDGITSSKHDDIAFIFDNMWFECPASWEDHPRWNDHQHGKDHAVCVDVVVGRKNSTEEVWRDSVNNQFWFKPAKTPPENKITGKPWTLEDDEQWLNHYGKNY